MTIDFTHHAELWINNDEGSYRHWTERADEVCPEVFEDEGLERRTAVHRLGEEMQAATSAAAEEVQGLGGMLRELLGLAVHAVDWDDVAEPYVDAWIEENRPSSTAKE